MTTKVTRTDYCDRCGEEVEKNHYTSVIGSLRFKLTNFRRIRNLYYMIKRNGSGSADSRMSLDLCGGCTKKFLKFMKNKEIDD